MLKVTHVLFTFLAGYALAKTDTTTKAPLARQDVSPKYRTALKGIFTSHGSLDPPFSPDRLTYNLKINQPVDRIALTPEIDQSNKEYNGFVNSPEVTLVWHGNEDAKPESASMAVRKMIDLPDDGTELPVLIRVRNPTDHSQSRTYKVNVKQNFSSKLTLLKYLDGVDDNSNGVVISPIVNEDNSVYNVYVRPDAKYVRLTPVCTTGSWVTVDGKSLSNGKSLKLWREKDHHRQTLDVVCGKGSYLGSKVTKTYIVHVMSDYRRADIPKPRLVLDSAGEDCKFVDKGLDSSYYSCPNPNSKTGKTKITGYINPTIKYTIESRNKDVEVRVLDGYPTIDFTYKSGLEVVAQSGQYTQRWPLKFDGAVGPGLMRMIGWMLAILLAVLLFALACVIGFANICGVGVPFGATEIACTLTLIMQYFCFANYMRGSSLLTHLTEPLRWVTLYWPLPWHMQDPSAPHRRHLFEGAMSHGVELWGDSLLGDVTDVRNACGALFWSTLIFLIVLLVHGCTILSFLIGQRSFTFPHRLRLGNWESRFLHWLSFPACTAASNVLAHSSTTLFWRVYAGVVLAVFFVWILGVFISMNIAVQKNQICWVWHTSVREDGELEDEAGYWNDIVCDQLTTHPVNRSLCKWFFSWKWISTVADLEPVNIHPNLFKRKNTEIYPPQEYGHTHSQTSFPQAKTPKTVEVIRTRRAMAVFPGQRLIAGLLRTQWLDILFTYQGLIRFHTEVVRDTGREMIVPVTVKTHQLTGPVTSGANAYFFDGSRVPFVRVFDAFFRILLGVFLGVSLASTRHSLDAIMFGLIATIALLSLIYMGVRTPYSRRLENWLGMGVFLVISLSAWAFLGYAVAKKEPSVAADAMLWLVAICCVVVSAYSIVVTFSVFSALLCPPLDESRFLEKLANCNVTLSDHNQGWAVDVPAFSKYGVRDLKASFSGSGRKGVHVSMYPSGEEPTLEFSVKDIKTACRTGSLPTPVLSVFAPSRETTLGYRYYNVFDRGNITAEISRFLAGDSATASSCEEVAKQMNHQVHLRGKGRTILSVTIVPSASERRHDSHAVVSVKTSSSY